MDKYHIDNDEETKDYSGQQLQLDVEEESKESKPLPKEQKLGMSAELEAKSKPK